MLVLPIISNKINIYSFLLFTVIGYLLLGGLELSSLRVVLDDRKNGMWGWCFERYNDVLGLWRGAL